MIKECSKLQRTGLFLRRLISTASRVKQVTHERVRHSSGAYRNVFVNDGSWILWQDYTKTSKLKFGPDVSAKSSLCTHIDSFGAAFEVILVGIIHPLQEILTQWRNIRHEFQQKRAEMFVELGTSLYDHKLSLYFLYNYHPIRSFFFLKIVITEDPNLMNGKEFIIHLRSFKDYYQRLAQFGEVMKEAKSETWKEFAYRFISSTGHRVTPNALRESLKKEMERICTLMLFVCLFVCLFFFFFV